MIKPGKLKSGDTVAIVSLSSGMAGEEIFHHKLKTGIQRLEQVFHLNVKVMPNALKGIAFLDKHPDARAADLMNAFEDDNINAIISVIGGDDTIQLLPFIDFDTIRSHPKIFIGYSDTTINHFMMYKAGLVSFYGPCLFVEFAENGAMHEYTIEHIFRTLFEEHDTLSIAPSPQWTSEFLDWADPALNNTFRTMTNDSKGYELLQGNGIVQGTLLGGCLDVLPMLAGTELWPSKSEWENAILFLETSEEYPTPSTLKYWLRGLAAQEILGHLSGILFAKPKDEKYYDEYKQVLLDVVTHEAGLTQIPILCNMNFGHTSPMCILPYGILAEIDCGNVTFRLLEQPTS